MKTQTVLRNFGAYMPVDVTED